MKEAYLKSVEELLSDFNSKSEGISNKEAQKRLEKYGPNIIKKKRTFKPLKVIISQFNSFLIYILLVASAISFLIGHSVDGFVISGIIVLNVSIGFFQQYKAENAISKLRKLVVSKTRVVRDGKQMEILSEELVPGDIIIFEAGDKVNADCRIIESENLETNEAILTGESLPVSKDIKAIKKEVPLAKRSNMLFAGTGITRGTGKGLVVSTGTKTIFGEIAQNLQEIKEVKTPMQKKLDKFSKQVGFVILGLVAIVAALGFSDKFDLVEMFVMAVALAVSAIPEGLPAVLTIGFAIASVLMSKKNVIIRRLPAVESLGGVTVICSDKTGTLTEEKMTVEELFVNNKILIKKGKEIFLGNKKINLEKNKELIKLVETSILCNNARFEKEKEDYTFIGDPTEISLLESSISLGFNKKELIEQNPSIKKIEFDSVRKMMSIVRINDDVKTMYSKGAMVKIIERSTKELINGKEKKITKERKKELIEFSKEMESKAYRVLAFAKKHVKNKKDEDENNLTFLGFMGMIDPPRMEVKSAIKECRNAGIAVKIITGDSAITAKAIAEKIGIKGKVISEEDLNAMTDEELESQIYDISIFARMTPKQKLRVTKTLQKLGETVAITGDGVNDVLALKSADVGVAMGIRGSDVSRDVADIVLMDDNFNSIVEGVKQGRVTYDNVKKFTKYLLAVNLGEIFLVLFALLFGMPLPLTALQILWINIAGDAFASLTLAFEKDYGVMKRKPNEDKSMLSGVWKFLVVAGIIGFGIKLAVYLISMSRNLAIEEVRSLVLTTAVFYELFFIYAVRSDKSLKEIGVFSNKWMNIAVLASFLLHLALLYTPMRSIFNLVPLTFENWLFIFPFIISGLVIFELGKIIKKYIKK